MGVFTFANEVNEMKRSFQPALAAFVLTATMLWAFVPASAVTIHLTDNGIHNYPPSTAAGDRVYLYGTTTVNVLTGGSIGFLEAYDQGKVNVSGGSIGGSLAAYYDSTVNVSGGSIGGSLEVYHDSRMTIFGTGFNFADGDYGPGSWTAGTTLTGTLADGTPFSNSVSINNFAKVTLTTIAVPEPSSFVLLGIGTAGLCSRVRRRKKSAA